MSLLGFKRELSSIVLSFKCLLYGKINAYSFLSLNIISFYNYIDKVSINYSTANLSKMDCKLTKDEVLIAYCNLFGNTKFISSNEVYDEFNLERYCKMLGVKLNRYKFITSDALFKSNDFHSVHSLLFENMIEYFLRINSLESIAFARYVKNKYLDNESGNINYGCHYVVSPCFYKKINEGTLLTFSLGGCVAIIVSNANSVCLGHFRWKGVGSIEKDMAFKKLISESNESMQKNDLYVVSDEPLMVIADLKKYINEFKEKYNLYIHTKDSNMIYSLKIISGRKGMEIKYRSNLKSIRNISGWRDPVCTIPFGDFVNLECQMLSD